MNRCVNVVGLLLSAGIFLLCCGCTQQLQPLAEPSDGALSGAQNTPASSDTASTLPPLPEEDAIRRVDEISVRFIEHLVKGTEEVFAVDNGYVLEQSGQTVNVRKLAEFVQALDEQETAELVVLKYGGVYQRYDVYLLQATMGDDCTVTITTSSNPPTQTLALSRYEQTENEYVFYVATEPLYIGKNGSSGYTGLCDHENWEHAIDTSLIALVGEHRYLQWLKQAAQNSLDYRRCEADILSFLKAFRIDYDTFVQTIGSNAPGYDLDRIRRKAYPDYLKIATQETSLAEIGTLCFAEYMRKQMSNKAEDGTQVLSYKLKNIELFAGDIEEFAVRVEYDYTFSGADKGMSVHAAGNGEYNGKDTITGAYRELRIKRVDKDSYAVLGVGTGGYGMWLAPID